MPDIKNMPKKMLALWRRQGMFCIAASSWNLWQITRWTKT